MAFQTPDSLCQAPAHLLTAHPNPPPITAPISRHSSSVSHHLCFTQTSVTVRNATTFYKWFFHAFHNQFWVSVPIREKTPISGAHGHPTAMKDVDQFWVGFNTPCLSSLLSFLPVYRESWRSSDKLPDESLWYQMIMWCFVLSFPWRLFFQKGRLY